MHAIDAPNRNSGGTGATGVETGYSVYKKNATFTSQAIIFVCAFLRNCRLHIGRTYTLPSCAVWHALGREKV